jgi:hypothetical protein
MPSLTATLFATRAVWCHIKLDDRLRMSRIADVENVDLGGEGIDHENALGGCRVVRNDLRLRMTPGCDRGDTADRVSSLDGDAASRGQTGMSWPGRWMMRKGEERFGGTWWGS